MRIEDLTPEQVDQLKACKTYEECMAFASEAGLEFDESEHNALRMFYDDPEAFAARVEQAYAEVEDADITEDELKALAGGKNDKGFWPIIVDLASGGAVTKQIMDNYRKFW